jgi:hypothetical protein
MIKINLLNRIKSPEEKRRCSSCRKMKFESEFHLRQNYCKECNKKYHREYMQKKKEK